MALAPLFALTFFSLTAAASSACNRAYGGQTVPYPFGFSAECPIRVTYSSAGGILLGNFTIRNFTFEAVNLAVPAICDRPSREVAGLFGRNYAMTGTNALFLRNCSSDSGGGGGGSAPAISPECNINASIITQRLNLGACNPKNGDIRCYSAVGEEQVLSKNQFEEAMMNCGSLFTVVRYGSDELNQTMLVFGAAEVGWWLDGECRCAANASCTHVAFGNISRKGFRCKCREGFDGDGFSDGDGCRPTVPKCSRSSSNSEGCKRQGVNVGGIVGGVAAGGCLALGLALLIYCLYRRAARCSASKTELATHCLLSEASCPIAVFSHKDVARATADFSDSQKLGSGAYATVYLGRFPNSGLVAIKRLKHPDTENLDHVINEIKLVSSVSHPHLVRLLGCCLDSGQHVLVYEFVPNGTLSQHLHRERGDGAAIPWPARVNIAAATAGAVAYLHTAVYPPIYHRDIKSNNILLDFDLRPKLADFGLSRAVVVESSHISTAPQGTPGYVDPQYHQNFHLSDKSDVYSFGVVLLEIITAMKVVDFRRAPDEVNLAALAVQRIGKGLVEEIVDPAIREGWDARTRAAVENVAELAFRCLAFHKEARPSMTEVAAELERIRDRVECGSGPQEGSERQEDDRRAVMIVEKEKIVSPVSVQDQWASCSSSSSLSNGSFRNSNR